MYVIAGVLFSEALDKHISTQYISYPVLGVLLLHKIFSLKKYKKKFSVFLPDRKTALLKPIVSPPAIF